MRFVYWFFRDRRSGQIVVGQWPNLPLWLFGIAAILAMVSTGAVALWSDIASRIFLAWWAGDELLRGVNPWRRCLGGAVLIWLAIRLVV